MTKEEFVYGVNRTDKRGRDIQDRRARFYDWWLEHKNGELPPLKVMAKAFGVKDGTIKRWISKLA